MWTLENVENDTLFTQYQNILNVVYYMTFIVTLSIRTH